MLLSATSLVLVAVGVMQCYRKKTGLFHSAQEERRRSLDGRTPAVEFRKIFRQISQGQRPTSLIQFFGYSHINENDDILSELQQASAAAATASNSTNSISNSNSASSRSTTNLTVNPMDTLCVTTEFEKRRRSASASSYVAKKVEAAEPLLEEDEHEEQGEEG